MVVKDNYGRPIHNIRVSITQKCDLNCFYCHKEGHDSVTDEMTHDEIPEIIRIASDFGIKRVKITGGEPLLRHDLPKIIRSISNIEGIEDISLVTNARTLSYDLALELRDEGLNRININLPSINETTYNKILGVELTPSLDGVKAAVNSGLNPVKVNMVLLNGINSNEVYSMIDFTQKEGAILQLIELEPLKMSDDIHKKYFFPLTNIEKDIAKQADNVFTRELMQNRKVYTLKNGAKIEFVRPVDNTEFCLHCTRMRLTNDGKLKPCLMSSDGLVDILTPLRNGEDEDKLRKLFLQAIKSRRPFYSEQKL
jgi:cyclic pyranopterin phosphate synthase